MASRATPLPHASLARAPLKQAGGESGQTLVMMAGALLAILAVAAFVIDISFLGVAHHEAQVAADAAALSAAQDLEDPNVAGNTVTTDATNIADHNDPGSTVTISQPSGAQAAAQVSAPVSLPFGGLFGIGTGHVAATAVAAVTTNQTVVADGNVSPTGCNNSLSDNCTYWSGGEVGEGPWIVTSQAEPPGTPANNNGVSSVNLQYCGGGVPNSPPCYEPDGTAENEVEVVDLNGETEGGMYQTISTVPGAKYVLSFWLTGDPALGTYTTFPMNVQITEGDQQYTPGTGESPTIITSKAFSVTDPIVDGTENADFVVESMTFTSLSPETTITFNSQTTDNDQYDSASGGDYYFYCGPELTNIELNYAGIMLVQ